MVSIGPPAVDAISRAAKAAAFAESVEHWLAAARERDDISYLSIYESDNVVGQIFLHDTDQQAMTSLVGYHLFEPRFRDRGIGTAALNLLLELVRSQTNLERLFIITSDDNAASQRVARKCGFVYVGPSREDPAHGMVFELTVTRPT